MTKVKERIQALLQTLSTEERRLLNRVLKIEHEVLYKAKPRVKEDLMRATKETVK